MVRYSQTAPQPGRFELLRDAITSQCTESQLSAHRGYVRLDAASARNRWHAGPVTTVRVVGPDIFIPIAEEAGLATDLAQAMLPVRILRELGDPSKTTP